MINHLIHKALEYETKNNFTYDYFVRIRPDLLLLEPIHFNTENCVFTAYKFDSPGNDQFFIINRKVLKVWWFNMIEPTLSQLDLYKGCPDYIIFNKCRQFVRQYFKSGIVRDYQKIDAWIHQHGKLNPPNYWLIPQTFELISRELFIETIKEILPYQQTVQ